MKYPFGCSGRTAMKGSLFTLRDSCILKIGQQKKISVSVSVNNHLSFQSIKFLCPFGSETVLISRDSMANEINVDLDHEELTF